MKQVVDPKVRMRRLIVRGALLLVFVALVFLTFVLGKGHSLIIDNKDLADGSLTAVREGNLVSVDGREASEIYPGDRIQESVKGQRHVVSVEGISGGDKIERTITFPIDSDILLLSIPKLIAGKEPYLEVFVPLRTERTAEEKAGTGNSFTSPDAIVPSAAGPEVLVPVP